MTMMMNSILGIEAASGGKPLAANARTQEKSNSSSDFSAFVAAENGRGEVPEKVSENAAEPAGESAVPKAEAGQEGTSAETSSEDANAGAGSETAAAGGQSDTAPETGIGSAGAKPEGPGAVEFAAIEIDRKPGMEAGNGTEPDAAGVGLEPEDMSETKAANIDETSRLPDSDDIPRLASDPGSKTPGTADRMVPERVEPDRAAPGRGELAAAGSSSQDAHGAVAAAAQQGSTPGEVSSLAVQSVLSGRQTKPDQPLADGERKIVSGTAAAGLEASTAAPPAVNGSRGSGHTVPADSAVRPAPSFSASAASGQASDGSGRALPLSGFPNAQAVEKLAAVQPEGVARAVAAGAQGAVQALAAGQPVTPAPHQKAQPDLSGMKVFDEVSEAAAEVAKAASADVRTGTAQVASAPQAALPAAAVIQSLQAGGMAEASAETDFLSLALGMTGDSPGLTQLLAEASFGTQAGHRPEMPRMIAAQIAEAFAAKGEQKVEVSLNPQELGHVKMRVVTSESGITMIIQTERPETGDLMRRHINELAEEFRRMGYEDISFEFSGGQTGGGQQGENEQGGSAQAGGRGETEMSGGMAAGAPATQNLRLGAAGVDMRV
ncbi:flagellar hook-length control protein FliK [Leisingera aquaemixtae]|uniref:flagellar hook-length control protein FliK n=1 Tax=Leisingera aquaemixtae TaxID=1396826 RepID=UPI001C93AF9A|nr:flagellar hook-length control protein FliK [Leisingera aquaemixtae]MBY6066440.1 flagellar hook-length control protein FliK [Leisingera aquaemixtae]